jgi:hypothetical protein
VGRAMLRGVVSGASGANGTITYFIVYQHRSPTGASIIVVRFMDIVPVLAGAAIGTVSSLLTLITSHVLQRRLQNRQWTREDAVRREQQAREDIKPLITIPTVTKGGEHAVILPSGRLYCFPPKTRITLADGQRQHWWKTCVLGTCC